MYITGIAGWLAEADYGDVCGPTTTTMIPGFVPMGPPMSSPDAPPLSDDPSVEPAYEMRETNLATNWPDDADIAICLTFDTQGAIDGLRQYHAGATSRWPNGDPNWWDYTERSYGIRTGLPRILDMLDRYDITGTFPTCGMTAEWYPDAIAEIAERGHEVSNHSYSHELLVDLDEEEERDEITRSAEAIEAVTGEAPTGWRSPVYSTSTRTLDLLLEANYLWDSSFFNYDTPYILSDGERELVEIPSHLDDWSLYLQSDEVAMHMGGLPKGTPDGVLDVLASEFDCLYEEARRTGDPRTFIYTMHPKITGRPHRAAGLERFIQYVHDKPGVWFTSVGDIAERAR